MKTRVTYVSAAIALLAATLMVAPVQAQKAVVSNWILELDIPGLELGTSQQIDSLIYLGGFRSKIADSSPPNGIPDVGEVQTMEMELSIPFCDLPFNFCKTFGTDGSELFRTHLDADESPFEITGYLRTVGDVYSVEANAGSDTGVTILTKHTSGTLEIWVDKTANGIPFADGVLGPGGGGMVGPVRDETFDDINKDLAGNPDMALIATFRLQVDDKPGGPGTVFNTGTKKGSSDTIFELESAKSGVIFDTRDKDNNLCNTEPPCDLGAFVADGGGPVLLNISMAATNADPDNDNMLNTAFSWGLFGEDCRTTNQKPNLFCGVVSGSLILNEEDPGQVQPCSIALDKTCAVAASSDDLMCQARIEATTLLYVGPDRPNVRVEFRGKDAGSALYPNVNLKSDVSVLRDGEPNGQSGFTINAGTGDGLGSRTDIFVNGVLEEVIHTSCSAMYEVGKHAPLDANSPNLLPGGAKGDPSPNWFVVNFEDRDGGFVEQPEPGAPANSCTVPFNGAEVTYEYKITNMGTTNVTLTSLTDEVADELDMLDLPATTLTPGETASTSILALITTDTVNKATATANVEGNASLECTAIDTVDVTVAPPPPASCRDSKPITTAALIWQDVDGQPDLMIDVITEAGELFEGIQPGNRINIQRGSAGNDVNVAIFDATNGARIGTSSFHLSCSDDAMNGVEDCDTAQGNGKRDDPALNNNWILDGMGGENGLFDCALENTGIVAPSPNGPADGVFGSFLGPTVTKDKLKWKLNNNGPETVYVTGVKVTWPAEQGNLKHVRLGRHNLTGEVSAAPPVAEFDVTDLVADVTKRAIESNRRRELKAHFKLDYEGDSVSDYRLEIRFNNGETVAFP